MKTKKGTSLSLPDEYLRLPLDVRDGLHLRGGVHLFFLNCT